MMRAQTPLSTTSVAHGVDSETANESELDLYFCDVSPVEHASLLANVDANIDPEAMSLLLQGAWRTQAVAASLVTPTTH
jgi:hypothetical protein